MMQPIETMSEAQFAALRERDLAMVTTNFDGSLTVRDSDGAIWNLGRGGDLLPHVERERHRVNLADLPAEDDTDVTPGP